MEPSVQYTKTRDGVTIAYYAIGSGPPIVIMDLPESHLLAEWRRPDIRAIYEATASLFTLVRYDHRGFGLSDRECHDFSLPSMLLDLEAVVDRLDLPPFSLIVQRGISSPVALAYSAKHPDRLTHLVLVGGVVRMPESFERAVASFMAVPGADWEFVSESTQRILRGWGENDASRSDAALIREAVDYETFREFWRDIAKWDATEFLPKITTPTLLLHASDVHPGNPFGPEQARKLAPHLQNVSTSMIKGATYAERNMQSAIVIGQFIGAPSSAISQFTRTPSSAPPDAAPPEVSGTAIILFTDIVDSTALTERLGDDAFREKARALDAAMRAVIRENGGAAVEGKTLGDGVLAVFTSAKQAITCAQACHDAAGAADLSLHAGIHAGDVIREADPDGRGNVYGGAVNIAARVAAASASGETLVSGTVRDLARTSAGVTFEDRGEQMLKGIEEPVRVYEVRWPHTTASL
jgi:class 3 adenylate cyclase/pimeloyl-ACP methyl ester carboxylesterase